MEGWTSQIAMYLLAAGVAGVVAGWVIRGKFSKSPVDQPAGGNQTELAVAIRQRNRFAEEYSKLRETIEALQQAAVRSRNDLEAANEKARLLDKGVLTLRAEREDTKAKVMTIQNAMLAVKQQTATLRQEFVKAGKFYKGELKKSFEKRQALEVQLEDARTERESSSSLLKSSRSESESINDMLDSAQVQLLQLGVHERNIDKLDKENDELRSNETRMKQEIESLQHRVKELEELKIHNKELVRGLESLENSRRKSETDAEKFRDRADESEQLSDTLRLKLDEVQKNFAEIEIQQQSAINDFKYDSVPQVSGDEPPPPDDQVDDLKKIVGIGKVFEKTLHDLGIYSYKQIADFNVGDVARVNSELDEFRGRMEQDDWIGQAKDLYYQKQSEMVEH